MTRAAMVVFLARGTAVVASFLDWVVAHWPLLVPLTLGYIALWSLLPSTRRINVLAMSLVGAAALVVGGFVLPRMTAPTVPLVFDVLFYVFAGGAIAAAVATIVQRNPVYAALWFASVILCTCGLFLLQAAPFLAAATIIVYAGAVIVTFLFVIMLAQQRGLADYDRRSREPAMACLAGFVLLGAMLYTLELNFFASIRITAATDRLASARQRVASKAVPPADVAKILQYDRRSIDDLLQEEIQRLPAWEEQSAMLARVSSAGTKLGAAVRDNDLAQMTTVLAELHEIAQATQAAAARYTGLLGIPKATASQMSHLSAKVPDTPYVTGLGRSLFGDYLYAVGLAAVLLLVATVGAVAISLRRREAVA